jgi:hypothetical protein
MLNSATNSCVRLAATVVVLASAHAWWQVAMGVLLAGTTLLSRAVLAACVIASRHDG